MGPAIISEINYHPSEPSPAALAAYPLLDRSDLEFVEVYNSSALSIDLTEWRIRGGVDFNFDEGETLASRETLLVLRFDPNKTDNAARTAAFKVHYGLGDDVKLLGGYSGQLNNSDDLVKLQRPDEPPAEEPGLIPRLLEDEVLYDDLAPWPVNADGLGQSLHRLSENGVGHLRESWTGATPTPGSVDFGAGLPGDFNADQLVDADDIGLLCGAINGGGDALFDVNSDGTVDDQDLEFMILSILGTTFGDANLDGRFTSSDLVQVFAAGQYEDAVAGNSAWASGDWNCDGDFNSSDLIVAFSFGGYTSGATPAVNSRAVDQVTADADFDLGLIAAAMDDDLATRN